MLEDSRLLELVNNGDKDGLNQIYAKYKNELLTIARSLLPDIHTAEDCLHNVIVKFVSSNSSSHIHNLRSYLIKSVVNQAKDQLKKTKKQSDCRVETLDYDSNSIAPSMRMIEIEESNKVFEALAKLPNEQREVIVMHIHGEMKFKEIADFQCVSTNTVQSRYAYGIEKLRTFLGKES